MLLRRLALEQSHLQPLVLGPAILEPELHVLRLQPRKLLAIRHLVQLLRVRQNELRTDRKIYLSDWPSLPWRGSRTISFFLRGAAEFERKYLNGSISTINARLNFNVTDIIRNTIKCINNFVHSLTETRKNLSAYVLSRITSTHIYFYGRLRADYRINAASIRV